MKQKAVLMIVAIAGLAAVLDAGALSNEPRVWGATAVRLLMTKAEQTAFDTVASDDEAKRFIELFWARRDPTPDTPVNEFREQIEQRMREADKRFATHDTRGSATDRGRVFVLFGEPDHVEVGVMSGNSAGESTSLSGSMGQFNRQLNSEIWTYRNEKAARFGTALREAQLFFQDTRFAGEMELAAGSRRVMEAASIAVARAALKRPFLREADLIPGAHELALRIIVVSDSAKAYELLRRVQEGGDFAEIARSNSTHASSQAGGYIGRIAAAELAPDFQAALADTKPGGSVVIKRSPTEFAVVKLLTDAEAAAADAAMKR